MPFFDRSGQAFQRALDAIRHDPTPAERSQAPLRFSTRFALCPERGAGGATRWVRALDWEDESPGEADASADSVPRPPTRVPADNFETVARELGLREAVTTEALTRRWRAYVWLNHPDRQPEDARERANARVAVANALYDQARRALRRR